MTTQDPCEQLRKERDEAEKKRAEAQGVKNSIIDAANTLGDEYQDKEKLQKARADEQAAEQVWRQKQHLLDECEKRHNLK